MSHVLVVHAHGDLGDPVVAQLPRGGGLRIHLLHLARGEGAVELALEEHSGLAVQDLEHGASEHLAPVHAARSSLALAVPGLNAVLPIDHVQSDRKRVDDLRREAPLGFDLTGPGGDLAGEVLGQLERSDEGGEDVGDDLHHVPEGRGAVAVGDPRLEQPQTLAFVRQREAEMPAVPIELRLLGAGEPAPDVLGRHVAGCVEPLAHDGPIGRAIGCAHPDTAVISPQAARQDAGHPGEHLFGAQTCGQVPGHVGQDSQPALVERLAHFGAGGGLAVCVRHCRERMAGWAPLQVIRLPCERRVRDPARPRLRYTFSLVLPSSPWLITVPQRNYVIRSSATWHTTSRSSRTLMTPLSRT